MYTDDDEIGRAVAADLEECWQGEGWYRICFTNGMGSYPATWYGAEADLAGGLRGAYGDAGEIHLPYAEISVIDQAVEKVWQGEGWYRGDGRRRREMGAGLLRYTRMPGRRTARRLRRGILQRRHMRPTCRAGPGP